MSSKNGMATVLGLAGIAVGGFYLYDRGRMDGQREAGECTICDLLKRMVDI